MSIGPASKVLARVLAVACLTLAAFGCKDANTVTGVQPLPTPAPTPIPTPAPLNLNGEWTGTLTYGADFEGAASCPSESIQVRLSHADGRIFGSFGTSCAGTIYLRGTVGEQPGEWALLTVDLDFYPGFNIARLGRGSASSTTITASSPSGTTLSLSR